MITFSTDVEISRPVEEVFNYISRGENNSYWNTTVKQVEKVDGCEDPLKCRYKMTRELPDGEVVNIYEVIEYEPNRVLTIRTVSGPDPFTYKYTFDTENGKTHIKLDGEVKGEVLPHKLPSFLASRMIKRDVDTNFENLKGILELCD
jgi:uncharacterized protein YndB with AHSA1/START domain